MNDDTATVEGASDRVKRVSRTVRRESIYFGPFSMVTAARSTALNTRALGKQTLYQLSYSRVGG
jgi:hypothetical protein